MRVEFTHPWDISSQEAIAIQESLRDRIVCTDRFDRVNWVAGVDVGFESNGKITRAAIALFSFPDLECHEHAIARRPTSFPYIPGLLSFREIPAILDALNQINQTPDLLLCDGQGYAHPRRFGLACHLGLIVDMPSIGVGKSRLIGASEPVGSKRGDSQPLWDSGEKIGVVLRTRTAVKPLFVSIGHRICLETAVSFVLRCGGKYRLPEPLRQAHHLASNR